MSEASGHRGLWTEPNYPGDAVRIQILYRGREIGDVRIQHYGSFICVASFLPGMTYSFPGDSPKTEPEKSEHFRHADPADALFDAYIQQAYADGWQNYNPEQHGQ